MLHSQAFASAGLGGWKLQGIVKPSDSPKFWIPSTTFRPPTLLLSKNKQDPAFWFFSWAEPNSSSFNCSGSLFQFGQTISSSNSGKVESNAVLLEMRMVIQEKHLEQLFYLKKKAKEKKFLRQFCWSDICSSLVCTAVFEMTNQMYRTVFVYNATNLIPS